MDKCNSCGAVESDVPVLFSVVCCNCFSAASLEQRKKIIEDAAAARKALMDSSEQATSSGNRNE